MDQKQKEAFYKQFCLNKAIQREETGTNFWDKWKFPSEVKKQYGDHVKYEMAPLNETTANGNEKFICSFIKSDGFLLNLHHALQLKSQKTGENYFVVELKPMESIDDAF